MPYPCFMIDDAGVSARWLRRFTYSQKARCPAVPAVKGKDGYEYWSGHEATTRIENARTIYTDWEATRSGRYRRSVAADRHDYPRDDPRWPSTCQACGYAFVEADTWQLFSLHLYSDEPPQEPDGHRHLWSIHPNKPLLGDLAAPVGAMWWADWFSDDESGPENKGALCVITPGGMWNIDAHSRNHDGSRGGKWSRNGTPPNVTVTPSILIGDPPLYHSFLTGGVLGDG